VTSLALLSKCQLIMELRFHAMLYSNLGNEYFDVGHVKCSRWPHFVCEPQVPHPCCTSWNSWNIPKCCHRLPHVFITDDYQMLRRAQSFWAQVAEACSLRDLMDQKRL